MHVYSKQDQIAYLTMLAFLDPLKINLSEDQSILEVKYESHTEAPLFDICDLEGRIMKSGKLSTSRLKIKVSDLINSIYIFLILDGDEVKTKRFQITRK